MSRHGGLVPVGLQAHRRTGRRSGAGLRAARWTPERRSDCRADLGIHAARRGCFAPREGGLWTLPAEHRRRACDSILLRVQDSFHDERVTVCMPGGRFRSAAAADIDEVTCPLRRRVGHRRRLIEIQLHRGGERRELRLHLLRDRHGFLDTAARVRVLRLGPLGFGIAQARPGFG
jgi:hypothetical protein